MAPMLGRKPFPLAKPLTEPLVPGEEIYTIEHSKESFRSKEEYEARLEKYGQRIWTCKSTGSSQLTNKEAWEEEQEVSELLQEEFQSWFEKPVLEIIHHNTLSLDKLVDQAHLEIMTKYAVDEECDFEVGKDKYMRVKIVKVYPLEEKDQESPEKKSETACDSPSSDKENSNQVVLDNHVKEPLLKDDDSGLMESLRDRLSDRARRSPRKLPTSLKKEEKKWAPPKFLPHKYDVKLENEDKIISNVPVDSLYRSERPPNKELIRYFIRHYALRLGMGENAPWVVEDELVKKYALPSKFSDFLLDPHKYMTLNSPPTPVTKKRKKSDSPEQKPPKKMKVKKDGEKNIKDKKRKKPPLAVPLSPTLWCHVHLNKTTIPSPLKTNNREGSKSPAANEPEEVMRVVSPSKLNSIQIPKKCSLSEVMMGKKKVKIQKAKVLNGQKLSEKPKSPKKVLKNPQKVLKNPQKVLKNPQKVLKNPQKVLKNPQKVLKNPKMKQITLLDMAKGSPKVSKPPKSTTVAPRTSSKPEKYVSPTALHLIAYYRDNKDREDRKASLSCLITKAVRMLTNDDRALLPEDLRALVEKRHQQLEHKKKWASMTEDQRKEFMREKRNELNEKLREKAKERREKEMQERLEKQRRYEDQELSGKSLPTLKLVDTPEGLPNTLFGDVAMVVEFLSCYSGLLMPDDQYPVTAVSLMEALTAEKGGFLYLNRVLLVLLQTLLQDEIAEDYAELGMKVSEIPLTLHSVSELVRLCLRKSDVQESSDGSSPGDNADDSKESGGFEDNEVEDEFLEKLETSEFFELTVEEKLHIMAALCHRILMTYSVEDHVEAKQQRSAELWRERLAMLKEENDKKRAEKLKRIEAKSKDPLKETNGSICNVEKEAEEKTVNEVKKKEAEQKGVKAEIKKRESDEKVVKTEAKKKEIEEKGAQTEATKEPEEKGAKTETKKEAEEKGIKTEVKKKDGDERGLKAEVKMEHRLDLDTEDMISVVKSRSLAKKEKEEQDRQLKEKLEKEAEEERVRKQRVAEEERVRKQRAAVEMAFHEGIAKAKLVLRRSPIGSDRNHNRYWLFSDEVPGLFVEKGWIHDSINYSCFPPTKELKEECDPEPEENMEMEADDTLDQSAGSLPIETSVPKQGQNLWFLCDTQKELDDLLGCLHPQGVRESELKERLQKRYQDIVHSIHLSRKQNPGLKNCDGQQELLNFLRNDVIEVATRLHKGGLGYLDETTEFETRVRSLDNLKDFGDCIISLQASVVKKFLQGFMAPKQKKRKPQSDDSAAKTEEVDDGKKMIEEAKVASAVEKWKAAIRDAQTFSRMHVLLGMLDACIKWDMSSENARCKVCRKKGEDDQLILCDQCNKAFHLFCLRPALYEIPDGEWQCPACQPSTARRNSRGRNYAEDSVEEDEENEDSSEEEEDDDEEDEDYTDVVGLRLRSRKTSKTRQSKAFRASRKSQPTRKKTTKASEKGSRQRTAPVNRADVDELVRQTKGTRGKNLELQKCEDILNKLIKYRSSWPFREPVTLEEAEDYMEIVSNPMDFQTMLSKCTCNKYHTVQEFLADIKLVFSNAELYNHVGSHVITCLEKTEDCLVTMLQKHLPNHTYQRRKRRKPLVKPQAPTTDEEGAEDSDLETVKHSRVKKKKK